MRYLGEHEVGYDSYELGFPSISGCLALVYVTNVGLFGYHNLGGNTSFHNPLRAAGFAAYVRSLTNGANLIGARLYGGAFFDFRYGRQKADWLTEMAAFATALNFKGKIRGFDISKTSASGNAFVKFINKRDKCEAFAQQWSDANMSKGTVSNQAFHRFLQPNSSPPEIRDRGIAVVTNFSEINLEKMPSIKLRG